MISRTALVTGGSSGIGYSIVKKLLDRGDKVIVLDYNKLDLADQSVADQSVADQSVADQSVADQSVADQIIYHKVDVSDIGSLKSVFNSLPPFDILVNNAGITRDGMAIRMSEEDWDKVLDVNLKGLFFCSQYAIKHFLKKQKGYIINISSIVAERGNPGQVNYAASKAGIIALTKTLAHEYGSRNILVNAIAPGFITTPLTDSLPERFKEAALNRIALKRFGHPDDVADVVLFLTSGNADYITGSIIAIDGGIN